MAQEEKKPKDLHQQLNDYKYTPSDIPEFSESV